MFACTAPLGDPLPGVEPASPVTLPEETCGEGVEVSFEELEPNETEPNAVSFEGGQVVIQGRAESCSNDGQYQWTGDRDLFVLDLACFGRPRFLLNWSGGATDLDFNVYAPEVLATDFLVVDYEAGLTPSDCWRDAPIDVFGRVEVSVFCWDGEPTDWELTMSWDAGEGDCTGDDDDSAGDDDDDSAGDDDDDSAGDDDDDSAGDDDDSSQNSGRSTR